MTRRLVLTLIITSICILGLALMTGCGRTETGYIGADHPQVHIYIEDESGEMVKDSSMPRGTAVEVRDEKDGYRQLVEKDSDVDRFVSAENFVLEKKDIVQEKKVYVRTPATIYNHEEGPSIGGFARKGSCLKVTGHVGLNKDGTVKKYKINYGDNYIGYVYGKYMVFSEEAAKANYNKNGEYDKAKKAKYPMNLHGGKATELDYYPYERTEIKGNKFCREARTMYLNYYAAIHNDKYIDLIKESGCNAVVIDVKSGTLAYKSPVAKEMSPNSYKHAHVSVEKYQKAVKEFQDAGIYTIGRITCFNDSYYIKDHPEARIKTKPASSWPSAYNRKLWQYNVSLAVEAVELMGFNEIQFDYVRFPETAYQMSTTKGTNFRNYYGESKAQAIQNFCFYATDQVHEAGAYVSIDVFGECSSGYVTAYGQYWPAISNIVDAISSMPYTDHFGSNDTWSHPYYLMKSWSIKAAKAQKMIPTPAVARTWITGYDTPCWNPSVNYDYKKMRQQIVPLYRYGLDGGFIPWNSSSSLDKYKQYKKIWSFSYDK